MLFSLLVTIILSSICVMLLIHKARAFGLVDVPNHRSSHIRMTPCGAGIGFIFAFLVGILSVGSSFYSQYIPIMVGITLVFLLGVYDDYRHTSSRTKFLIILLSALLVYYNGLMINNIGSYFDETVSLGWLAFPFTIIAVVGFTNALNLLDGIDGLATITSIIILAGLGYIGYSFDNPLVFKLSMILMAALLTFLVFNWNPAKIFMGDSGSLTLGFVIAILSIEVTRYIDPVSILFITALPILDTVSVMIRRKTEGVSLIRADKNHIHHILLEYFNGNVQKTVALLGFIQLSFTLFGVFIAPEHSQENTLPLFFFSLLLFYWISEKIRRQRVEDSD